MELQKTIFICTTPSRILAQTYDLLVQCLKIDNPHFLSLVVYNINGTFYMVFQFSAYFSEGDAKHYLLQQGGHVILVNNQIILNEYQEQCLQGLVKNNWEVTVEHGTDCDLKEYRTKQRHVIFYKIVYRVTNQLFDKLAHDIRIKNQHFSHVNVYNINKQLIVVAFTFTDDQYESASLREIFSQYVFCVEDFDPSIQTLDQFFQCAAYIDELSKIDIGLEYGNCYDMLLYRLNQQQLTESVPNQPQGTMSFKSNWNRRYQFVLDLEQPVQIQILPELEIQLKNQARQIQDVLVYQVPDGDLQILVINTDKFGDGLYKQYFTSGRQGSTTLGKFGVQTKKRSQIKTEQELFKRYVILDVVYGKKDAYEKYLIQSKAGDALLNVENQSSTHKGGKGGKKKNRTHLLMDTFTAQIISGKISTFEDFLRDYVEQANLEDIRIINNKEKEMRNIVKNLSKSGLLSKPTIPALQSLYQYAYDHPLGEGEMPLTEQLLAEWGYQDVIRAMFRVFVLRQYTKERAIWICGMANTGKTRFSKMIDEIFICDELVESESKFHFKKRELRYTPQIILMDEANCEHYFKPNNIAKMKRFLEGRGWQTEEKWGTLDLQFENASILITSNDTPFRNGTPFGHGNGKLSSVDEYAIKERTAYCPLKMKSHKKSESFPFNTRQLAQFLICMYKSQQDNTHEEEDQYDDDQEEENDDDKDQQMEYEDNQQREQKHIDLVMGKQCKSMDVDTIQKMYQDGTIVVNDDKLLPQRKVKSLLDFMVNDKSKQIKKKKQSVKSSGINSVKNYTLTSREISCGLQTQLSFGQKSL